jgi:hypothetical protein
MMDMYFYLISRHDLSILLLLMSSAILAMQYPIVLKPSNLVELMRSTQCTDHFIHHTVYTSNQQLLQSFRVHNSHSCLVCYAMCTR